MNKLFSILLIIVSIFSYADNSVSINKSSKILISSFSEQNINYKLYNDTNKFIINEKGDTIYIKKRKITAIMLALLTGPIGGHRLYLGTKPIVPVVYAVTLGGGFLVIPIMDIITIIFTKDLSKFENNDQVIMWINGDNSEEFYEYEDSE